MRKTTIPAWTLILALGLWNSAFADDASLGRTVDGLLDYARNNNPEYSSMRHEADAAGERVTPAGALPDPRAVTDRPGGDRTPPGIRRPTRSRGPRTGAPP